MSETPRPLGGKIRKERERERKKKEGKNRTSLARLVSAPWTLRDR